MSTLKSPNRDSIQKIQEVLGTIPPKHIYTRMKSIKNGILITLSNLGGCPKENYKGDGLTQTPCKNSFYQAISKFLKKNKNNRVVFMGNFFGNGPYVMTVMFNIMLLIQEFNYTDGKSRTELGDKQVEIVLGDKDINIWRCKYELHKTLLQQDINIPELDIEMPSMVKFTKKEGSQDKVFGDYIPYNSRIEKDFSRITTTAIVNSLFHRMMKILKTCGCHIPDCFLFNHNFSELYYLAKNEQNIELMVLVQQLSVFVLVYPFAPKKRYEPYIYEGEIFNIIEHILFKIEDIILEFRSYRTDIYVRRMYEINNRIKMLLANSDTKVHLEEVLPLKNWSNVLVHFYDNASLIHYDEKFGTIFSKYDPNYCLPLFFNTFLSYSKYVENDPQKEFKEKPKTEGNIWSIENYYERYKKIYLKFLCLKLVNRVSNSKNHPYQDFLNKKVSGERELGEMSSSNDMGDFSNSNINNSNGGGKSKKSAMTLKKKRKHNNTISLKKSLKRNRYERIKGGGIDYDELSVCTGFDSIIFNSGIVPLGKIYKLDIKNNRYSELNIHFECRYINRIFREICKYPATLQNDKELNLFLFIQSFYTFMRKNRRRQSPFNGRHVRQNKDLYDMLKFKKIYNIVVGDYDLNLSFDLPLINFYGVSFIFCDKVNETKKKFATARKAKITHDNYDDYSDNELLKIYNYPLIAINMEGDFEHTSLTISGNLKIKKTFLGKYYFHTFRNFFLLHEPLTDVKLMEYKNNFVINAETNYHKLEVYMLPLFRTDNLNQYPKTFFIDNMYFIKLFDATPELKEMFMIIDMEYALKGGKIGTYLGNITQWLGFFWDGKRLYRRKIKNIPNTIKDLQTFLKYYLPAMTTNILNLPLTEPIDIELKKEKSLLKNNYKLYRELKNKDFMSLRELERLLHKKNDCPDDDMLDRLKKMFEMIFHSKNMRPKKYKLNYHQLSDNDEFELGITIEEKIKKKEVLLPVNNVDAYKGTLLGKGRFKKIFPYDRRDVVTTKQRFVVSDERKNKFTDKYFKEVSLLIFASFQESTPKYSPYIVHLRCLNIWENDFYYLIPRSFLGSLDQVLNDGGKINGKDFLTSGKNISNVNFYNLMLQICQAMLYLHDKFLLHLDLYERNILIYENQGSFLFQLNDLGYGEVNLGKQVEMNKSNIMEFVEARNTNFNEDSYFYEFNNGFGYTKLKIVECPNTQKNYRITNYISKGVPSMSCPIAVQDRFNIFGNQTDMWSYGYIFIKIICQMYSTLHPEEHCKNFSSIKSSSGKYGKIKEIFKVINFYTASNLATLEGETKINAINLLYYLLVNPIQKKNIVSYPQPDYLESEIYIDSKFSDLQETKPGKGEYQMINKLLLNQISEEEELLFHKSEKITLGLTEDTMKLMHLCLVNWCQRVEFTDMLDFLQKHKDFKTMGTFIIPLEMTLPTIKPEKIIVTQEPELENERIPEIEDEPISQKEYNSIIAQAPTGSNHKKRRKAIKKKKYQNTIPDDVTKEKPIKEGLLPEDVIEWEPGNDALCDSPQFSGIAEFSSYKSVETIKKGITPYEGYTIKDGKPYNFKMLEFKNRPGESAIPTDRCINLSFFLNEARKLLKTVIRYPEMYENNTGVFKRYTNSINDPKYVFKVDENSTYTFEIPNIQLPSENMESKMIDINSGYQCMLQGILENYINELHIDYEQNQKNFYLHTFMMYLIQEINNFHTTANQELKDKLSYNKGSYISIEYLFNVVKNFDSRTFFYPRFFINRLRHFIIHTHYKPNDSMEINQTNFYPILEKDPSRYNSLSSNEKKIFNRIQRMYERNINRVKGGISMSLESNKENYRLREYDMINIVKMFNLIMYFDNKLYSRSPKVTTDANIPTNKYVFILNITDGTFSYQAKDKSLIKGQPINKISDKLKKISSEK